MAKDLPLREGSGNRPLAAVASPPRRPAAQRAARKAGEAVPERESGDAARAAASQPLARFRFPATITVEGALYLAILAAAILSRFFNLGYQAQHHDESLHSYFSWLYYTGSGYIHDPLMHGPFLFHGASLSYLLFGDSDATSRYFAAFISVLTTLLPWFLRREFGRWGALITSGLLLASPSFLYFGRFHRHDVYSAFFTLLFFVAIVRIVADRKPIWLYVGAAAWGFHFTNKEDFFIITAIFGSALLLALFWSASRRLIWVAGAGVVALGFAARVLPKLLGWPHMPEIPWDTPTNDEIVSYAFAFIAHPAVIASACVIVGLAVFLVQQLRIIAGERTWNDALFGEAAPGTPGAAAHMVFGDRRLLFSALGLFGGIYTVLYTAFFSNLGGIFSGSFGAIFYWLGQQDVRRGEQPWFYYFQLMLQYDPVPFLLGGFGMVLTGWRLLAYRAFGRDEGPFPFARGFLAYWAFASVALYTWTGEKMPWIVVHPVLPLLLLAGVFLGAMVDRSARSARRAAVAGADTPAARPAFPVPQSSWLYGGLIVAVLIGGFILTARLVYEGEPLSEYQGWNLLFVPWLLIAGLAALLASARGWAQAGRTVALAITAALVLFQVHAGWALAFQTGDVPKDMLVYVQTSPDVTRFMDELDEFSALQTGGKDIRLYYDDSTSWPFQWYLRDYPNKTFFSCTPNCTLSGPPDDGTAIVLVGNDNLAGHPELASLLSDYVAQPYEMRWHFPEEVYRVFAVAPELGSVGAQPGYTSDLNGVFGSVFSSFTATLTPQGQAHLFRILAYRDLGAPLGSYGFTVFVHKDYLPQFNEIRYR